MTILVENIRGVLPKKKQSVAELAEKAVVFLKGLKEISPELFPVWYEQGRLKKDAMKREVLLDAGHLADIIQKEWDKKMPELGSHFAFWTGNTDDEANAQVNFNIGQTNDNRHLRNMVGVSFPAREGLRYSKEDQRISDIIALMKRAWEPSEVVITSP